MTSKLGSTRRFTIDTPNNLLEVDVIRTNSGRVYRIVEIHEQIRGRRRGRWHIRAVSMDPRFVTADDVTIQLRWFHR